MFYLIGRFRKRITLVPFVDNDIVGFFWLSAVMFVQPTNIVSD